MSCLCVSSSELGCDGAANASATHGAEAPCSHDVSGAALAGTLQAQILSKASFMSSSITFEELEATANRSRENLASPCSPGQRAALAVYSYGYIRVVVQGSGTLDGRRHCAPQVMRLIRSLDSSPFIPRIEVLNLQMNAGEASFRNSQACIFVLPDLSPNGIKPSFTALDGWQSCCTHGIFILRSPSATLRNSPSVAQCPSHSHTRSVNTCLVAPLSDDLPYRPMDDSTL